MRIETNTKTEKMEEFISKWSNWWILAPKRKQLDEAFEKELNELIEQKVLEYRKAEQLRKNAVSLSLPCPNCSCINCANKRQGNHR